MAEFNEDELQPPAWLDAAFFLQVLRQDDEESREEELEISELFVAPACQKGDHYASIMFRASLVYGPAGRPAEAQRYRTMIVKTLPPPDTPKGRILADVELFENERRIYAELVPRFEREWRRCGENVKFAGRLLFHSNHTPQPVLVLEDLCAAGFDVVRGRSLNGDEVRRCLRKLAKWHAVSHKLAMRREQDQDDDDRNADVTRMQHGMFKSPSLMSSAYLSDGVRAVVRALEAAGGCEAELVKLRHLAPRIIERCVALNDAHARGVAGPVYVLNHGDFHDKNIMIDFQQSFFGPSTYDLTFAAFTLLSRELREQQREPLMRDYFAEFVASLEKLGVPEPHPTYADLEADRRRWSCFEIYLVSTFLPLTQLSDTPRPPLDMNAVFDSAEYRAELYREEAYLEVLRKLLPEYLEAGFLD